MGLFGGGSAKPHKLWSNDQQLLQLIVKDRAYLSKADREQIKGAGKPLVRKYVDKRGKVRHSGISGNLKASQCLGVKLEKALRLRAYTAAFGARVASSFVQIREECITFCFIYI